jgi:hypothetical protein
MDIVLCIIRVMKRGLEYDLNYPADVQFLANIEYDPGHDRHLQVDLIEQFQQMMIQFMNVVLALRVANMDFSLVLLAVMPRLCWKCF